MVAKLDLTGQRFGRLVVLEEAHSKGKQTRWKCICDCGNETVTTTGSLRSGHTKSCGCFCKEQTSKSKKTHGQSNTRLHHIWTGIKTRCFNKNFSNYHLYGGRGIKMFEQWRTSFSSFRDWAIASGYKDGLTIDRKDTDGDYTPENCTWTDMKSQCRNRRTNVFYKGKTLAEWCDLYGVSQSLLYSRRKRGMSIEEALTTPIRKFDKHRTKESEQ